MDVSGALILADLLAEKVRRHPDRTCVVFEDARGGVRSLSYAELSALVDRLCNALLAEGVRPGDKVAIMMGNCVEFLVSWLAVNQAGAVMVSVNTAYTADELRYLLNHSDSVAIILEQRFAPLFDAVENYGLLHSLLSPLFSLWPLIASICATIKFTLLLLGLLYALIGWLWPKKI